MKFRSLVALVLVAAPFAAHAEGTVYKLDNSKSTLSYKIVHKFHEVTGKTSKLEGAMAQKGDQMMVQVRVDVGSFDSDNANRDAHMKETVEASKYPYATLKGVLKDFKMPTSFPADVKATLAGQLEFHGKTNPVNAPVSVTFTDANHAHATSEFDISLDGYGVERPSLMFVKIEDACHVKADFTLGNGASAAKADAH